MVDWLPKRRYLQRVLSSLSLPELQHWDDLDTTVIIADLLARDREGRGPRR